MSTDTSLSTLGLFIDAHSSGKVHQRAINHYGAINHYVISEKYLSEQLLAYRDTQQEYGEYGGLGGIQNCQPPNAASPEAFCSWFSNSSTCEAPALLARRAGIQGWEEELTPKGWWHMIAEQLQKGCPLAAEDAVDKQA